MKRYYYIPLCNKDFTFENIFSCESISPINFYKSRNFGISYFFKHPDFNLDEVIVLYNEIPDFTVDISSNTIRFILELKQDEIAPEDIIVIDENIIAIQKTIYLRKDNFRVLFFSETEMKITLAKSETSLPTKSLEKYRNNFSLIDSSIKVFDISILKKTKIINTNFQNEVFFDRKFNLYKGFVYGLVTGLISEKTPDEIRLKRGIQEVINLYAELKNRAINSRGSDSKFSKSSIYSPTAYPRMKLSVDALQKSFFEVIPQKNLDDLQLSELLFKKFPKQLQTLERAELFIDFGKLEDEIFGTNKFFFLKRLLLSDSLDKNLPLLFEGLNESLRNIFSDPNSLLPRRGQQTSEEEFKSILFKLSSFISEYFVKMSSQNEIDINDIEYDSLKDNVTLSPLSKLLKESDKGEFFAIANIILKLAKQKVGESTKDDLLLIVEKVGAAISKSYIAKDTKLYRYLDNQINSYSLERVTSSIMKNFVAFIFNPDSLEKLEKFLDVNELTNKWVAYTFWCSYNGFANISGNFLRPIFGIADNPINEILDEYMTSLNQKIRQIPFQIQNIKTNNEITSKNDEESKKEEFFEKCISGKFNMLLGDFIEVMSKSNNVDKMKLLKNNFGISNSAAKKIFDSYSSFVESPPLF